MVCRSEVLVQVDVSLWSRWSSRLMIHTPLAGYNSGKYAFNEFTHLRPTLENPGLFVIFRWHVDRL
jgi:hypothetical protein